MRRFIAAMTAILLAAPAAFAADSLPDSTPLAMPVPQATIMARSFGPIHSCVAMQDAYDAGGWPRGTGLDTLKQIDSRVKQRVALRNDPGADVWTPLAATILAGKRATGDCDDISVTVSQMAVCAGMPADRLGLLITESPRSGADELHMLAFYADPSDRTWVFGDTFGRPRALSQVRQKLLFFTHIDHPTKWFALRGRDGAPLTSDLPAGTSAIPDLPIVPAKGSCTGTWGEGQG
ncbi:hypothetical protein GU927_007330 [Rhodobacteraceae bacterium HSP-20]|uniref:Transglutaminase n=1 Tax=Paragemmobacter amnigenus TaxID=2852097 RepID=A0ABS6J1M8_9RHOB|nr:hypothetical protein [Rhodobacter amnigenus]MBU9697656.1 hypothetical protein [Rhodobacter amnigenus]MBV4388883.1 hypothetical protein [Rhodobacter amnigenus]